MATKKIIIKRKTRYKIEAIQQKNKTWFTRITAPNGYIIHMNAGFNKPAGTKKNIIALWKSMQQELPGLMESIIFVPFK